MIVVVGDSAAPATALVGALVDAGARALGDPAEDWADPFSDGIWFRTNPRPDGTYLFPQAHRATVVRMSPAGLVRSDPAYLDRVIFVVDHPHAAASREGWIAAAHTVLVDASVRGLPLWTLSAARPPGPAHGELEDWIAQAGAPLAKPLAMRTRPAPEGGADELLDALHAALASRGELSSELAETLNREAAQIASAALVG